MTENTEKVSKPLAPRHAAFVRHYLKTGNATKAATLAGYSKQGSRRQGSDLLKRTDISERIQKHSEEAAKEAGMVAEEVLNRLASIARDAPHDRDKIRALELIGRRLKLWQDEDDPEKKNAVAVINLTLAGPTEKPATSIDT